MANESLLNLEDYYDENRRQWILRLYSLIKFFGEKVIREVLRYFIAEEHLREVLNLPVVKRELCRLKTHKFLNESQWYLLYPHPSQNERFKIEDCDISLAFILLQNVCTSPKAITTKEPLDLRKLNSKSDPDPSDTSLEANLLRIKLSRNLIIHESEAKLLESDLQERFQCLSKIIIQIASNLGIKDTIAKEIASIKESFLQRGDCFCSSFDFSVVEQWITVVSTQSDTDISSFTRDEKLREKLMLVLKENKKMVTVNPSTKYELKESNGYFVLKHKSDPVSKAVIKCALCLIHPREVFTYLYEHCRYLVTRASTAVFALFGVTVEDIRPHCLLFKVSYANADSFTEIIRHLRSGQLQKLFCEAFEILADEFKEELGSLNFDKIAFESSHLDLMMLDNNFESIDIDNYRKYLVCTSDKSLWKKFFDYILPDWIPAWFHGKHTHSAISRETDLDPNVSSLLIDEVKKPNFNTDLVIALIEEGNDVNAQDKFGNSVLLRVIESYDARNKKHMHIMNLLLKKADLNSTNMSQDTALHWAATTNKWYLIKDLIDCGVNINAVNNQGDTALHRAVMNNSAESVEVLYVYASDVMGRVLDPNMVNNVGFTPLDLSERVDYCIDIDPKIRRILQTDPDIWFEESTLFDTKTSVMKFTEMRRSPSSGSIEDASMEMIIDWLKEHYIY